MILICNTEETLAMAHAAEQFIYPYQPVEWRHSQTPDSVNWVCIDDRPTLIPMAYRQTAGGAIGVGHDVAAAQILGGEYADNVAPVHIMGSRAVSTLRLQGNVLLGTHENCKAELAALAVRDIVVNDPDQAYANTLKVNPDMSESRFEQLADAYAQLKIENPADTSKLLDTGYMPTSMPKGAVGTVYGYGPVHRHTLMDMEHVAPDALIDNRRGVAFDNREALDAGVPAYHFSRGDQQELLDGGLREGFRIEDQNYLDFSDVRHGVTLGVLTAPNGDPLNLHHITA
ncbi:MAG TPA: hypothetical protein VLA92_01955 [Candidatus Saccharimonadales bacterium]|nr:hypothetical protein [Candidatus Saccharimonadales bacterium]